jgi:predicted alpha/beta hydrolase family esterase
LGKRVADVDILMIPGLNNSGPEHWQSRWQERLSTARRVEQRDWDRPIRDEWVDGILKAIAACRQPVVLIGHSLGVPAVIHAAQRIPKGDVIGAFLVAPAGETAIELEDAIDNHFAPVPREKLPFPSVVVAGQDDPYCPFLTAEEYAAAWGSDFVDAGHSGHINTDSGHGPWPEGLMRFAGFLAKL